MRFLYILLEVSKSASESCRKWRCLMLLNERTWEKNYDRNNHWSCIFSGVFGLIAAPIVRINGVLSNGTEESYNMLQWNCIGLGVLIAWNLAAATLQFAILDRLGVLRVTADAEIRGLDVIKHNEKAYGFGTGLTPRATPPPFFIPPPISNNLLTVAALKVRRLSQALNPLNSNHQNHAWTPRKIFSWYKSLFC